MFTKKHENYVKMNAIVILTTDDKKSGNLKFIPKLNA